MRLGRRPYNEEREAILEAAAKSPTPELSGGESGGEITARAETTIEAPVGEVERGDVVDVVIEPVPGQSGLRGTTISDLLVDNDAYVEVPVPPLPVGEYTIKVEREGELLARYPLVAGLSRV